MATGLASWSQTAASNSTADSSINWAEGQAPSSVNDSARALMASMAKWRDDNAGTLLTTGSSTAYVLATNQGFASLAALSGNSLRVKFHTTNGAAPTLAVDGLTTHAIVTVTGTAIATGSIRTNTIYDLVYSNATTEFILIGGSPSLQAFDSGTLMLFQQTSAPTGWTKQSTHNDKALRVVTGSASSGGSTAFSTVFGARTISQAQLPNITPTISFSGTQLVVTDNTTTATNSAAGYNGYANSRFSQVSATCSSINGNQAQADMAFQVNYVDLIIAAKD